MDMGTLGSTPTLISINKMLIELDDPRITRKATSLLHKLNKDVVSLKRYILKNDCVFYIRMLHMLRDSYLNNLEGRKDSLPLVLKTSLQCAIVTAFREAQKEVSGIVKENISRRQAGLRLL